MGGLLGDGSLVSEGSLNQNEVFVNLSASIRVGGLFGDIADTIIANSVISGKVYGDQTGRAGGAAGNVSSVIEISSFSNVMFAGDLQGQWVGGIFGAGSANVIQARTNGVLNALNAGDAGGIAGLMEGGGISLSYSSMVITAGSGSAGGLIGNYDQNGANGGALTHCYFAGTVTGGSNSGAIAGRMVPDANITITEVLSYGGHVQTSVPAAVSGAFIGSANPALLTFVRSAFWDSEELFGFSTKYQNGNPVAGYPVLEGLMPASGALFLEQSPELPVTYWPTGVWKSDPDSGLPVINEVTPVNEL
jgi:hypothetical protein